ncbi:MAG: LamG-like jellyroll fold domain-containing protein [Bacteroidia bacterium]|nr:LamG-like jellyroll fold domain-containing protein [Bacteroidia bacterium]
MMAQQGPGGVGTPGSADFMVWLQSQSGITTGTGSAVTQWADLSGHNHLFVSTKYPVLAVAGSGSWAGTPVVRFDGDKYLQAPDVITSANDLTLITVLAPAHAGSHVWLSAGTTSGTGFWWGTDLTGTATARFHLLTRTFPSHIPGSGMPRLLSLTRQGPLLYHTLDGAQVQASAAGAGSLTPPQPLSLGTDPELGQFFTGDIAEIIGFNRPLTAPEWVLIQNYLEAQYQCPIAYDVYAQPVPTQYRTRVAGIGRLAGISHVAGSSGDLTLINRSFLQDDGDFILAGYEPRPAGWVQDALPQHVTARQRESWYLDVTDAGQPGGEIDLRFAMADTAIRGTYALLYRPEAGNWEIASLSATTGPDYIGFLATGLRDGWYALARYEAPGAGYSVLLDGQQTYIQAEESLFDPDSGTIETWVRQTGTGTGRVPVFGSYGGNQQRGPGIFLPGGQVFWEFGGMHSRNSGISLAANTWHHLAMTWSRQGATFDLKLYVDGILVDKAEQVSDPGGFLSGVYLGYYGGETGSYLAGELDEVRIWSRARTAADIRQGMCLRIAPEQQTHLTACFRLDETVGTWFQNAAGGLPARLQGPAATVRMASGAPLGDQVAYAYPVGAAWDSLHISLPLSSSELALSEITGAEGIHLVYTGEAAAGGTWPSSLDPDWASGAFSVFAAGEGQTSWKLTLSPSDPLVTLHTGNRIAWRTPGPDTVWKTAGTVADLTRQHRVWRSSQRHVTGVPASRAASPGVSVPPGAGNALCLTQAGDHVSTGLYLSGQPDQPLTIEAWINPADIPRDRSIILDAGGNVRFLLHRDGHIYVFHLGQGLPPAGPVTPGQWHHIAYVYDPAAQKGTVWLDGIPRTALVLTSPAPVTGSGLVLGRHHSLDQYAYAGCLDEVRIWASVIAPETLQAWMCRKIHPDHPDFLTLRGCYRFDEPATGGRIMTENFATGEGISVRTLTHSAAPLGDQAAVQVQGGAPGMLRLDHPDGDFLTFTDFEGPQPSAAWLYRVDEPSTAQHGSMLLRWSERRYYGYYIPAADADLRWTCTLGYTGYPESHNEAGLTLATRPDARTDTWENVYSLLDMEQDQVSERLGGTTGEVILGETEPFAVGWLSADARWAGGAVEISWATAWEADPYRYIVERRQADTEFEAIGWIAASGAAQGAVYQLYDRQFEGLASGTLYYRVRQTNPDGTFSLSEVMTVAYKTFEGLVTMGPNPCEDRLEITLEGIHATPVRLEVYDAAGRLIASDRIEPGLSGYTLDMSPWIPGIYHVSLHDQDQVYTTRVMRP